MPKPIRFVLALHNHQPIGNFDHVFEQAFHESYRPFLDLFERYESLKIALHTSGSLMEWLEDHHPDYVDRLADLVDRGRIEIIGGAFFEPILAMIPSRDRIGQIRRYTTWLEDRLGATIRGMWVPERVWEQSFTRDLVDGGIEYTILDDFHFKCAGLTEDQLYRHFITEDDGRLLAVFPGSERLRYTIPFQDPEATIEYLRQLAEEHPDPVVVFGDDGEKFGTWPETHKHVYHDRWLERFFDALVQNQDWIQVTTLADAFDHVAPAGKIYLPDCSYREMTEWALPPNRQTEYDRISHEMEHDHRWPLLRPFVRGGFWRNFNVKYSESNEMYSRMMAVSRRLDELARSGVTGEWMETAQAELYRGQCNCSYWHGAFGGIYLPHLRNAVFQHLIAADNALDRAEDRPEAWVEAMAGDLDFDSRQEIRLANDKIVALLAPSRGGLLYELDVRAIQHNLLATMTRRPEAYHRKVLAGQTASGDECASIHDRVVFKQDGLDQRIQYDDYPRKSMVDLFYDNGVSLDAVAAGQATQYGNFVQGAYDARVRRNPDRIQILLSRSGQVGGVPIRLTKGVTLNAGSSTLEIAYLLEGLQKDHPLHLGVEFNFAGMPAGADDRYFHGGNGTPCGQLGERLDLTDTQTLGLADDWLGIDVTFKTSRPTSFWTFPIETVSQSEGGFELVHQSVVVQPHWIVRSDTNGRWSAAIQLELDTSRAKNQQHNHSAVAAT
jgi:alpha-amylase